MNSSKHYSTIQNFSDRDGWNHLLRAARERGYTVAVVIDAFELLHADHVKVLEAARELADWIIVAVESDGAIQARCGAQRPLVPQEERAELVAGFESVDQVILLADKGDVSDLVYEVQPDWLVMKRESAQPSLPAGCQLRWVDTEPNRTSKLIEAMLK